MPKTIKFSTDSYNEAHYSKPWIAKIIFLPNDKSRPIFGQWDGVPGRKGELSIEAERGDILAVGQKATHGREKPTRYYMVLADARLEPLGVDKKEARVAWARYRRLGHTSSKQEAQKQPDAEVSDAKDSIVDDAGDSAPTLDTQDNEEGRGIRNRISLIQERLTKLEHLLAQAQAEASGIKKDLGELFQRAPY